RPRAGGSNPATPGARSLPPAAPCVLIHDGQAHLHGTDVIVRNARVGMIVGSLSVAVTMLIVGSGVAVATSNSPPSRTQVLGFDRLPGLGRLSSRPASPGTTMLVAVGLQTPTALAEEPLYR